ncbi:MAG: amidase [Anaerolineae bacterium]
MTNINPHFGPARNPWNTDCITGGSSGGSAAAIGAGLCAGTLGSDTGGSIRIPASLCGVVGLKPTFGRVSRRGVVPLAWSLDHVGPMGRCVNDVALLFEVIDRYDADDPDAMRDVARVRWNETPYTQNSAFRVGIPDDYFFSELHPETEAAYRVAIKTIEALGFAQRDIALPNFAISEKASAKLLLADAAAYHRERIESQADRIGEDVLTRFRWGLEVTGVDYALARRTQIEWQHKFDRVFETIEALVLPATPFPATRIDDSDPLALSKGNLTRFTRMFNLTGHPSIVLPCGFTTDGLPIGLQIIGPRWREDVILHLAHAYEAATAWHMRHPDLTSAPAA